MNEISFPSCPICNKEVLLPFSSVSVDVKTFSIWFCSNCGFCLTTANNRAINPEKDINTGFNLDLRQKIREMKEQYNKTEL